MSVKVSLIKQLECCYEEQRKVFALIQADNLQIASQGKYIFAPLNGGAFLNTKSKNFKQTILTGEKRLERHTARMKELIEEEKAILDKLEKESNGN